MATCFGHLLKRRAELSIDCHLVVSWIIVWVNWEHLTEDPARKIFNSTSREGFTAMIHSWKMVLLHHVESELLPQIEEFKYIGVLFSEGSSTFEIDSQIGATVAIIWLWYRIVVVKQRQSSQVY